MKKLYVVAALLALFGIADALYLTIEHLTGQSVRCTIISGCSGAFEASNTQPLRENVSHPF